MTYSLRQTLSRLRAFLRKQPLDSDLDREMAAHLDLAIEENLQRGMSVEAQLRARALGRAYQDAAADADGYRSGDGCVVCRGETDRIAPLWDHPSRPRNIRWHGRPAMRGCADCRISSGAARLADRPDGRPPC